MQTINAVKKLEKAGFVVHTEKGYKYTAKKGHNMITFWNQDSSISCINAQHVDDASDSQRDYFAGTYCDNLSQAIKISN